MIISTLYDSAQSAPDFAAQGWHDFSPAEIACKCGCGRVLVHTAAMDALQALRTRVGRPIRLSSSYRCAAHNRAVGGAEMSYHREGMAHDVLLDGHDRDELVAAALASGFRGIGTYETFVHVDVRPVPAKWSG
jgi:zinc D-Ala-D-Ala carboxypeptidase